MASKQAAGKKPAASTSRARTTTEGSGAKTAMKGLPVTNTHAGVPSAVKAVMSARLQSGSTGAGTAAVVKKEPAEEEVLTEEGAAQTRLDELIELLTQTTKEEERIKIFQELVQLLSSGSLRIGLMKRKQKEGLLVASLKDMVSKCQPLAQEVYRMWAVCLADERFSRSFQPRETKVFFENMHNCIVRHKDELTCRLILRCMVVQDFPEFNLQDQLRSITAIIRASNNLHVKERAHTLETELALFIQRLMQQIPRKMLSASTHWAIVLIRLSLHRTAEARNIAFSVLKTHLQAFASSEDLKSESVAYIADKKLNLQLEELFALDPVRALELVCLFLDFLQQHFHRGFILNFILRTCQLGFKSSSSEETKILAFTAWRKLIGILALDPAILTETKRLNILMTVFNASNARTEAVALEKFHTWWFFIKGLGRNAGNCFEEVVAPFMRFVVHGMASATFHMTSAYDQFPFTKLGKTQPFSVILSKGPEVLAMVLGPPQAALQGHISYSGFSIEPLTEKVFIVPQEFSQQAVFLMVILHQLVIKLKEEFPGELLVYIWHSYMEQLKSAFPTMNAHRRPEVLDTLLNIFKTMATTQLVAPSMVLDLLVPVIKLPLNLLWSESCTMGYPCHCLVEILLCPPVCKLEPTVKQFTEVFKLLLNAVERGQELDFLEHVMARVERVRPAEGSTSLQRIWATVAHRVQDYMNRYTNVDQAGRKGEYKFNCLLKILAFPGQRCVIDPLDRGTVTKMLKLWKRLYVLFAHLSEKVIAADSNVGCEELCEKLLDYIIDKVSLGQLHVLSTMSLVLMDSFVFGNLGRNEAYRLQNERVFQEECKKDRQRPLMKLHFFTYLAVKLLQATNTYIELKVFPPKIDPKDSPEETLKESAHCLVEALTKLFARVPPSPVIVLLLEELVSPLAVMYQASAHRTMRTLHNREFFKKLYDLWVNISGCLRSRYKGQYDSVLLATVAPLLGAAFVHPYRDMQRRSQTFWQNTFGKAESLTYPSTLKPVLVRVKDALEITLPDWTFNNITPLNVDYLFNSDQDSLDETDSQLNWPQYLPREKTVNGGRLQETVTASSSTKKAEKKTPASKPAKKAVKEMIHVDDMPASAFVVIKSTPKKPNPKNMTEHQLEVLNERKDPTSGRFVPDLNPFLGGSQDLSILDRFETQSPNPLFHEEEGGDGAEKKTSDSNGADATSSALAVPSWTDRDDAAHFPDGPVTAAPVDDTPKADLVSQPEQEVTVVEETQNSAMEPPTTARRLKPRRARSSSVESSDSAASQGSQRSRRGRSSSQASQGSSQSAKSASEDVAPCSSSQPSFSAQPERRLCRVRTRSLSFDVEKNDAASSGGAESEGSQEKGGRGKGQRFTSIRPRTATSSQQAEDVAVALAPVDSNGQSSQTCDAKAKSNGSVQKVPTNSFKVALVKEDEIKPATEGQTKTMKLDDVKAVQGNSSDEAVPMELDARECTPPMRDEGNSAPPKSPPTTTPFKRRGRPRKNPSCPNSPGGAKETSEKPSSVCTRKRSRRSNARLWGDNSDQKLVQDKETGQIMCVSPPKKVPKKTEEVALSSGEIACQGLLSQGMLQGGVSLESRSLSDEVDRLSQSSNSPGNSEKCSETTTQTQGTMTESESSDNSDHEDETSAKFDKVRSRVHDQLSGSNLVDIPFAVSPDKPSMEVDESLKAGTLGEGSEGGVDSDTMSEGFDPQALSTLLESAPDAEVSHSDEVCSPSLTESPADSISTDSPSLLAPQSFDPSDVPTLKTASTPPRNKRKSFVPKKLSPKLLRSRGKVEKPPSPKNRRSAKKTGKAKPAVSAKTSKPDGAGQQKKQTSTKHSSSQKPKGDSTSQEQDKSKTEVAPVEKTTSDESSQEQARSSPGHEATQESRKGTASKDFAELNKRKRFAVRRVVAKEKVKRKPGSKGKTGGKVASPPSNNSPKETGSRTAKPPENKKTQPPKPSKSCVVLLNAMTPEQLSQLSRPGCSSSQAVEVKAETPAPAKQEDSDEDIIPSSLETSRVEVSQKEKQSAPPCESGADAAKVSLEPAPVMEEKGAVLYLETSKPSGDVSLTDDVCLADDERSSTDDSETEKPLWVPHSEPEKERSGILRLSWASPSDKASAAVTPAGSKPKPEPDCQKNTSSTKTEDSAVPARCSSGDKTPKSTPKRQLPKLFPKEETTVSPKGERTDKLYEMYMASIQKPKPRTGSHLASARTSDGKSLASEFSTPIRIGDRQMTLDELSRTKVSPEDAEKALKNLPPMNRSIRMVFQSKLLKASEPDPPATSPPSPPKESTPTLESQGTPGCVGILKKRGSSQRETEPGPSTPKQRRVSFAHPVSTERFIETSRQRKIDEWASVREPESQSPSQQGSSQTSYTSSPEIELSATRQLFPQLKKCMDPISDILPKLTTRTLVPGLRKLFKVNGIYTIRDLAMLTELELAQYPVQTPKVEWARKCLEEHGKEWLARGRRSRPQTAFIRSDKYLQRIKTDSQEKARKRSSSLLAGQKKSAQMASTSEHADANAGSEDEMEDNAVEKENTEDSTPLPSVEEALSRVVKDEEIEYEPGAKRSKGSDSEDSDDDSRPKEKKLALQATKTSSQKAESQDNDAGQEEEDAAGTQPFQASDGTEECESQGCEVSADQGAESKPASPSLNVSLQTLVAQANRIKDEAQRKKVLQDLETIASSVSDVCQKIYEHGH